MPAVGCDGSAEARQPTVARLDSCAPKEPPPLLLTGESAGGERRAAARWIARVRRTALGGSPGSLPAIRVAMRVDRRSAGDAAPQDTDRSASRRCSRRNRAAPGGKAASRDDGGLPASKAGKLAARPCHEPAEDSPLRLPAEGGIRPTRRLRGPVGESSGSLGRMRSSPPARTAARRAPRLSERRYPGGGSSCVSRLLRRGRPPRGSAVHVGRRPQIRYSRQPRPTGGEKFRGGSTPRAADRPSRSVAQARLPKDAEHDPCSSAGVRRPVRAPPRAVRRRLLGPSGAPALHRSRARPEDFRVRRVAARSQP